MLDDLNILSIITIAFLGGFGHCVGMCGGIVIAYAAKKINSTFGKAKEQIAHLSYNFGRVTTYTAIGFVLGFLGSVVVFDATTYALLFLIAGIAMVLAGLSLLGKLRFLTLVEHSFTSFEWYKKSFSRLIGSNSLWSFYLLGVLNGLLPCGFVYFFALSAASTADPISGAFVMALFGISTIFALMLVGNSVSIIQKLKFRDVLTKIAAILVILYGLNTLHTSWYFYSDPTATLGKCH